MTSSHIFRPFPSSGLTAAGSCFCSLTPTEHDAKSIGVRRLSIHSWCTCSHVALCDSHSQSWEWNWYWWNFTKSPNKQEITVEENWILYYHCTSMTPEAHFTWSALILRVKFTKLVITCHRYRMVYSLLGLHWHLDLVESSEQQKHVSSCWFSRSRHNSSLNMSFSESDIRVHNFHFHSWLDSFGWPFELFLGGSWCVQWLKFLFSVLLYHSGVRYSILVELHLCSCSGALMRNTNNSYLCHFRWKQTTCPTTLFFF